MTIRILAAILAVAAFGLGACGKSEEPAKEQAAPQTGAAQEEKAMAEQPTAAAPEQPAEPKAGGN